MLVFSVCVRVHDCARVGVCVCGARPREAYLFSREFPGGGKKKKKIVERRKSLKPSVNSLWPDPSHSESSSLTLFGLNTPFLLLLLLLSFEYHFLLLLLLLLLFPTRQQCGRRNEEEGYSWVVLRDTEERGRGVGDGQE